MAFPSTLSAGNLTTIRAGNYYATPYLLINPGEVVFAAQVNQTIFSATFASVTFNNITTGAITNVLDGFTVFIGATTDIRDAFVLRARGNGSVGTTLNINETSYDIKNDYYITVIKDVAIREKLGRYVNKVMYVDWDITFRQLLPRITGLQSAYAKKLSSGLATFTFPAVGKGSTYGATISTYSWNADGGSFVNGTTSASAQPDIQYNTAGVYWPRLTITDSGGRSNWFTMPVFVMSADMSDDFIYTGANNLSITHQLETGNEMRFTYFADEMADVYERALVVLYNEDYYNGNTTPIIDGIQFVGRLRNEQNKTDVDKETGQKQETPFTVEGILGQLNRLRSPKLALSYDDTPTEFQQIAKMTQWRMVIFVLSEFSTALNLHSLEFDDETITYMNAQDSTEDQSLLASCNTLLSARKAALNQAAQGELYGATNANFDSDSDRNALDVITTFTTNDLFNINVTRDKVPMVGEITLFGGAYSSANGSLRIIRANAPGIASLEAQGIGTPITDILQATDSTLAEQSAEAEQLVANALADANPKDIVNVDILDGYHFLMPANFQWYKLTIAITDNNRNIVYDSNDRFILNNIDKIYNGTSWDVGIVLRHETQGVGAKVISQVTPGAVEPSVPVIPSIPAYPGFPVDDTIFLPTGYNDFNIPSIGQGDGAIVITPLEPSLDADVATKKGSVVMIADSNNEELFLTLAFTETDNPEWNSIFTADAGYSIRDAKFDPHSTGAYVLTTDGSNNTKFYRTDNVFENPPSWDEQSTTLEDIEYTTIRTTATPDEVYIFGIDDRVPPSTVNLLNSNGRTDAIGNSLEPSNRSAVHGAPVTNAPGTYKTSPWNLFDGLNGNGDNGGNACNIEYTMPGRAILNSVQAYMDAQRFAITSGERVCEISYEGISLATSSFPSGTYPFSANPLAGTGVRVLSLGSLTYPAGTILFHASLDREDDGVRINQITMTFSDSGKDVPAFRRSDSAGDSFYGLKPCGKEITSPGEPGYDTGAIDTTVLLGADDIVRGTDDYGVSFGDKVGTDTTGTYAAAIKAYGKQANVDTIVAAADIFDTDKTVLSIENASPVDITPDDGVDKGIVVNRNSLTMSRISDDDIWMLADFGGTIKLCYTDDRGATSWTFPTTGVSSGANCIRVKETGIKQIYVSDVSVVRYSNNGAATGSWHIKTTPATDILLVEVR